MSVPPVRTTCPYCGVGCGILSSRSADGRVAIAGDPEHPANFGRLCSKGAALGETLALQDRLLHPLIHGRQATWNQALDRVAARFTQTIAEHGADAVAFYVSGQLLTEDYYVANKLMKGFIGSANIDTNSRLCMASSVAGHKRAFGSDTVPGNYEDLELADLVVLVGSNLAWCHPVLYQRLNAARLTRGTKVVVIDPRKTATCEIADLHLSLASGTDVALFNGLLHYLHATGHLDHDHIARHTNGWLPTLDAARHASPGEVSRITGLPERDVVAFYELWAGTSRTVTAFSQGVNQSSAGTDKVNAIINCHLATGRIGKPGAGPFSVTGQPNAMGGREVGGLANMLAAHMDLDNAGHRRIVQEHWRSPRIADQPGLKAVELFRAVGEGRVKALWIMATNPVDSLPQADSVREALGRCPFVVVSDVARHTDTTAFGHILLPSAAWGEKDGTVTNSERRISRQRPFLDPPGEAKPDWWQLAEVARRMGFAGAFDYAGPAGIFAEHARLSAADNDGSRDFDIGAYGCLDATGYEALAPFQWPKPIGSAVGEARLFAAGGYFTADRRARLLPTPYRAPVSAPSPDLPLVLNTGRIRDQWHTMTRTGQSARLMAHMSEPFVEIHPTDAQNHGVKAAELATVSSRYGEAVVRVLITEGQQQGTLFLPIHWTDQFSSSARAGALIASAVDPVSGQPELKHTPVRIARFAAGWHGFAVCAARPKVPSADYWAMARAKAGWRLELAGLTPREDWQAMAGSLVAGDDDSAALELLSYQDATRGQHRWAIFKGTRLVAVLFVAPTPVTVARGAVAELLGTPCDSDSARYQLLSGRSPAGRLDAGAIVCACFEVGRNQIIAAAGSGEGATVEGIGQATRAGTNCGSCRSEIAGLLAALRQTVPPTADISRPGAGSA